MTRVVVIGGDTAGMSAASTALRRAGAARHARQQARPGDRAEPGRRLRRVPGVVGTAVSRVCDLEIARTGVSEAVARAAGLDVVGVTISSTTRAGYFPGASPVTVRMLAERGTRRLLGVQIVGREGSAKRVDVCATALWNSMTVDEMINLDLGYAPPFSPRRCDHWRQDEGLMETQACAGICRGDGPGLVRIPGGATRD